MDIFDLETLNQKYLEYYTKSIYTNYNIYLMQIDIEYLTKKINLLKDIKVNAVRNIDYFKSDKYYEIALKMPLNNYLAVVGDTLSKYESVLKKSEESLKNLRDDLLKYNSYIQTICDLKK